MSAHDLRGTENVISDDDARSIFAKEYGSEIEISNVEPVIVGQPPVLGKQYSDSSGDRKLTISNDGVWVQLINVPSYYNGPCNIELRKFIRVGNGQVSHYRDDVNDERSETITCTGTENWGGLNYTWKLKRDPMIDWVKVPGWNEDTEETFGSQFPPTFNDSGGNFIEQRSVFYALNQARFFTTQNMYNQYTPMRSDEEIHPRFGYSWPGGKWGRYDYLNQQLDVFVDAASNEGTLATAAHEYGHHAEWRYRNPGTACTDGVNEEKATQEATASLIGLLFWLDDGQVQGEYGSISPSDYALAVTEHRAGTTKNVTNSTETAECPLFTSDTRAAFEQAIWEIMFNRNCSIQTCSASSGHGSYLYYNQSREQVLTKVGDSLAYALRLEGNSPTFEGLVERFVSRTYAKSGSLAGNRVLAVFVHHGFYQ